jgi:hypothetical protein
VNATKKDLISDISKAWVHLTNIIPNEKKMPKNPNRVVHSYETPV